MSEKTGPSKDATKKIDLNKKLTTKKPDQKPQTPRNNNKKRSLIASIFHGIFSVTSNIALLVLLVVLIAGYFVCDYVSDIISEIPTIDPTTIAESLTENSIIVDKNGIVLETLYGDAGMRTKIEYENIGQNMINAIVAIEDKTFFEHTGFNYLRLGKAALDSFRSGEDAKGTSSITQQLAKNLYLTNEVKIERKVKEAYYAILLERALTKEQILWAYLNKIALGMNANGVQSASMLYFSKDAKDLSLVESAIIAGIPKSPAAYAPMKRLLKENVTPEHIIIDDSDEIYTLVFNEDAQVRYEIVLDQMYNNDMITEAEYALRNEDISKFIHPTIDQSNLISSYFGDLVKNDASKALSEVLNITPAEAEVMLYNRGYIIESTIDFALQSQIEGIYDATVFTDDFDSATKTAVMRFQKNNGLVEDGIAGQNTIKTLVEQTSFSAEDFTQTPFQLWNKNDEVIKLKKALDELSLLTNDGLFPKAAVIFDGSGNILNDLNMKVSLFKYDNMINSDKKLIIKNENYYYDNQDNLVLLKDKGLDFYQKDVGVQVVLNDLCVYDEDTSDSDVIDGQRFYNISGLYIFQAEDVMFPKEYLTKVDGNLVIDKTFFIDYPNFLEKGDNGDFLIDKSKYYLVDRGVIQPQSAFVLIDQHTGEIKAMIGGRDSKGQNIFNRALQPQQPGSSIKPIGVYSAAINSKAYTAATVIDDIPSFLDDKDTSKRWPINWYEANEFKYRGRMNLRQGVEFSINVLAVKLSQMVGVDNVIAQLENLGITTIQKTTVNGQNDVNLSAVSLGGMTNGISPLELTAAYATYANQGVYIEPISFTRITDLSGNIIVENKPEKRVALDPQVAFIVQDMMISAVTTGVSNSSRLQGMTMAGKTGTTSDKRDALFVGYTPYYTAAVWFGNDVKLKMDDGSVKAAKFWKVVMTELHKDLEDIGFVEPPGIQRVSVDRVSGKRPGELSSSDPAGSQVYQELFLPGTAPTETDDAHALVTICLDNPDHRIATEYCPNTQEVVLRTRLDVYNPDDLSSKFGNSYYPMDYRLTVPSKECELHTSETITIDGKGADVVQYIDDGVYFIRDYNLLLYNDTFKLIPIGSKILIDYTIVFPSGEMVMASEYNIDYVTRPETQIQELLRRSQEAEGEEPIVEPPPVDPPATDENN